MLDQKDTDIISVLKEDARLPYRDIAKKTKLRHTTVHHRIHKLKESGVIEKFTIKLNNKAIGENFIVFMFVTTDKDLQPTVLDDPHIKEIFGVTGEYDLILKLKFKDIEEFNSFVIRFRRNTGIRKTITMVSTITIKEDL